MAGNKKPRKAYRPRPVTAHTMALATDNAAKPAAADRAEVLAMLSQAVKALREGVATELQWSIVAGSVTVALAIERQGVVRGLLEHLQSAEQALQAIYDRATSSGRWMRATLYFHELDVLADFLSFHTFQVNQLGRAEFLAAIDAAQKHTIAQGHTATLARDLERLAA
jgi:malonyl CoA-acyl carrier protein transacylase